MTNAAYITLNGKYGKNNNDAQLTFRPLNSNLAPDSGNYYSLATNQTSDPSLRINRWSSDGTLLEYGYLYDTLFNPPDFSGSSSGSAYRLVAGGNGPDVLLYSTGSNPVSWDPSINGSEDLSNCRALASNGTIWVAGGRSNLLYSSTGDTWFPSINGAALLNGSTCYAVATNGSFWVAGAYDSSNTVLYSYDGKTWYPSATGTMLLNSGCLAISWNGSMWVAGGIGVTSLIYSNDGITWSTSENGLALLYQCHSLIWGGTFWLAGGNGPNTLISSYDGIHWISNGSPLRNYCYALAYSGDLFVAGGQDLSSSLIYSYDGLTWRNATPSASLFTVCYAVVWTGSNWIAGGQGSYPFLESSDGITWRTISMPVPLVTQGYALALNRYVPLPTVTIPTMLMGGYGSDSSPIVTSTDGLTWAPINPSTSPDLSGNRCAALAWNGSIWVGGFLYGDASHNTVCYSYDGLTWVKSSSGSSYLTERCLALAFSKTKWLAGGKGTTYMISSIDNGYTWTDISSVTPLITGDGYIATIGYNGSVWIAGAGQTTNKLLYSANGINWFVSTSGNAVFGGNYCNSVAWNGQIWVAVGDSIIAYSSDGITWTQAPASAAIDSWKTVATNGSLWVAGGQGQSRIAYSYDGLQWFPSPSAATIFSVSCKSVAWTGSLWIAGGEGATQTSAYSYNGITWFPSPTGKGILSPVAVVASTRMSLLDASAIPPPILYPSSSMIPGNVVYSTGLNSMYVSSIMSIDNSNAIVSIQGDLSANTFSVGSFNSTSIVATNVIGAGTLNLGSSDANPTAIVITDTTTTIANFSLGNKILVSYINSVSDISAIDISNTITTVYNASIQPYNSIIDTPVYPTPYEYLPGPGTYLIKALTSQIIPPAINPLMRIRIRRPGRYIICNYGTFSGSYSQIQVFIETEWPPGPSPTVATIADRLLAVQYTLTFDIILVPFTPADGNPKLIGANLIVAQL